MFTHHLHPLPTTSPTTSLSLPFLSFCDYLDKNNKKREGITDRGGGWWVVVGDILYFKERETKS